MDGSESIRIAATAPASGVTRRKVMLVAAVWVAVVAAALGVGAALDTPPEPPPPASVAPEGLPPLFLYLDRSLPADVVNRPDIGAQVERLQELATSTDNPARWVELGVVAQRIGDLGAAKLAFQRALVVDPGRLDAQIGLAMTDGATGPEGLARAATTLADLAATFPTSQLLTFNTAMVAVYRRDAPTIAREFGRAAALGPTTPLGVLARKFAGAGGDPTGTP